MAIKIYKPTTPARRQMSVVNYQDLTVNKPYKKLTHFKKSVAGRDNLGHISIRHKGDGAKRKFRQIDSLQDHLGVECVIKTIEYDPNRGGFISLIELPNKNKHYILTPDKVKVGDKLTSGEKTDLKFGNRMKVKNIPTGVSIYDIELTPGDRGKLAKGAGCSSQIAARASGEGKRAEYVQIKLPSGEIRLIHGNCFASIGRVSNLDHDSIRLGKAGRVRWMGIRPTVRGKAMNPNSHPHGGGEGNSPIGMKHPKTPWGKHARGFKTRKNRRTEKYIIKHRKK